MKKFERLSLVGIRRLVQMLNIQGHISPDDLHTGTDKEQRKALAQFLGRTPYASIRAAHAACRLSRADETILTGALAAPDMVVVHDGSLVVRLLEAMDTRTQSVKYSKIYKAIAKNPERMYRELAAEVCVSESSIAHAMVRFRAYGIVRYESKNGHMYNVCNIPEDETLLASIRDAKTRTAAIIRLKNMKVNA